MPNNILTAIIAAREDWRNRLTADYEATATRLQEAYGRTLPRLQNQRDLLIGRLQELAANDDALTVRRMRGLAEYQNLAAGIETEMQGFAAIARNEAATLSQNAVQMGLLSAEDMALASAGQGRQLVAGMWNRPDPAALQRLVGYVDSEAMRAKYAAFGANAGRNFADTVLAGVAQGLNPKATARLISNWLNVPLAWAASSVRTVQLYSYRKAAHETYRANGDILDGWVWIASLDSRCCMSCISQHGSKHGLDEELNDHHQGRCLIPGQGVTTQRGIIPIENVKTGDFVLTHQGRYKRVLNTFSRDYSGQVLRVSVQGQHVTVTPEHPIYTQRGWVEARDLSASDTFLTLNSSLVRSSKRKTNQPSSFNRLSFLASIGRFLFELCQRGSYSTANISSGNAKSILNDSTANCGIGFNSALLSASRNRNSPSEQNVRQLFWRPIANLARLSGVCAALIHRESNSGSFSNWRRNASFGGIGSISQSLMSFISDLVLIPVSFVSSRYVACSSMYLRLSHCATGSPSLTSNSRNHFADCKAPTSFALRLGSPNDLRLWSTLFAVLPGNSAAISSTVKSASCDTMIASSSGVQNFPAMLDAPRLMYTGTSIHRLGYSGKVYDLEIEDDHSFFANGIAVHNCSPAPIVKGTTWANDIQSGEDWYNQQSPEVQRSLAGDGAYEALKSGKIQMSDFVQPYQDNVYGTMTRQASLKDMLTNPRSKIATPYGYVPRDTGTPGHDINSLREFVFESDGPLAKALMNDDMGLLEFNMETGGYDINKTNVANAAKAFVVESRDIQYGKDYILSLVQETAQQNGVNLNSVDIEKMYNREMSYRAQAIQLTADIGNVRLTEAQRRRLEQGANGGWLDMVYTTESSERGSLANATRRRGGPGLSGYELQQARENFRNWVQGID